MGVVADVCSTQDTQRVFETAVREFGDVDILINNAGIGEQKLIDEMDDDWMMYVMNTNLGGPMRYIREALKILLPKNDGVIINISSVNGTRPFCGATWPTRPESSPAVPKCWSTAATSSTSPDPSAIPWTRPMPVCSWPARWAAT